MQKVILLEPVSAVWMSVDAGVTVSVQDHIAENLIKAGRARAVSAVATPRRKAAPVPAKPEAETHAEFMRRMRSKGLVT
jgi:hypothetical protein